MCVSNSLWPCVARQAHLSMWILQARILQWVARPFSRGSSHPRDGTQISHIACRFFTTEPPGKPFYPGSNPAVCLLFSRGEVEVMKGEEDNDASFCWAGVGIQQEEGSWEILKEIRILNCQKAGLVRLSHLNFALWDPLSLSLPWAAHAVFRWRGKGTMEGDFCGPFALCMTFLSY